MRAIGYVRVSTAGQAETGVSMEAQRARIEAFCAANGHDLEAVHVDAGMSGGRSDNRPGLQAALDAVTGAEPGVLVVYSLSRLARSVKDTLDLAERIEKAGANLASVTENIDTCGACGKMIFQMLTVLAEFERNLTSERTTAALSHLRSQGRRISGRIPFGFDLDDDGRTLTENVGEQYGLGVMRQLRDDGLSLRKIGRELERRGIEARSGNPWTAGTIRGILQRATA